MAKRKPAAIAAGFAGLLSLRLPTYGELVAAGDRLNDDLPES